MQMRNNRSTGKPATPEENDGLLSCRMAMLGLDCRAIECGDSKTFDEIKRRCTLCEFSEACAVDLKRDPNNPVWEMYCPNARTFNALTGTWW